MKTKTYLLTLVIAFIFNNMNAQEYDDVYYNSTDRALENINSGNNAVDETQYTSPEEYSTRKNSGYDYYNNTSSTGNRYYSSDTTQNKSQTIVNNYYGDYYDYSYDDYYDYAYSARIRRFYHPYYSYNFGYYNNYYTNCYFYEYNPWCYGTSIYLGYNWLWPRSTWSISWNSYWGWNIGWSWSSYPVYTAWSPWGGYYAVSYMYPGWRWRNAYWRGYRNGYWNGYYDGLYGYNPSYYYYNSYDQNTRNIYYGHRSSESASTNRMASTKSSGGTGTFKPFSAKYEEAVRKENPSLNTHSKNIATPVKDKNTVVTPKDRPAVSSGGSKGISTNTKPVKPNSNTSVISRPPSKGLNQKGGNVPYYERTSPSTYPKVSPGSTSPKRNDQPYVSPKPSTKDGGYVTPRNTKPITPKTNNSSPKYNRYSPAPKRSSVTPKTYSSPAPKTNYSPSYHNRSSSPSIGRSGGSFGGGIKSPSTSPRGGRLPR